MRNSLVSRLGYDQVGSLKAVAAQEPDGALRVVKVVDYDSFGAILSDTNPSLFLPLAFAAGLRDRFTGLVRFCHRDYDPTVGRFTAQDPMGDTGGDHDPYDYCVDDPVGRVDPEGLEGEAAVASGGFLDGLAGWFSKMGDQIGNLFKSDTPPAPGAEAAVLKEMDTVSRGVDSALGKAKDAINSVRPEVDEIAKGADVAGKITMPQEAHEAATKLEREVSSDQRQREELLDKFKSGRTPDEQADAALKLAEHYQNSTRPMILGKPGEVVREFNKWFNPFPFTPKKE